jgi:hypothetical protein
MISSSAAQLVLGIDLEKAWKELDFDSGWSNAIPVEVYIR